MRQKARALLSLPCFYRTFSLSHLTFFSHGEGGRRKLVGVKSIKARRPDSHSASRSAKKATDGLILCEYLITHPLLDSMSDYPCASLRVVSNHHVVVREELEKFSSFLFFRGRTLFVCLLGRSFRSLYSTHSRQAQYCGWKDELGVFPSFFSV